MTDVMETDLSESGDIPQVRIRKIDESDRFKTIYTDSIPRRIYTPGEVVTIDPSVLKGHGTYEDDDKLKSLVAGVCERISKLILVKPVRYRYTGEVGDVVVGRIVEVQQKRWRVNVRARLDAVLQLTSVNLPGGELRRKCEEDERMMRKYLSEGELVSAEVHSVYSDGSLCLHTRSLKYGKLSLGLLVEVPPSLIKRCKTHFHNLCGISLIIGMNGSIWLYPTPNPTEAPSGGFASTQDVSVELIDRQNITRVNLCIRALADNRMLIYDTTIVLAYEESKNYTLDQLTDSDVITEIIIGTQKRLNSPDGFYN